MQQERVGDPIPLLWRAMNRVTVRWMIELPRQLTIDKEFTTGHFS